jgi:hypothetical protein
MLAASSLLTGPVGIYGAGTPSSDPFYATTTGGTYNVSGASGIVEKAFKGAFGGVYRDPCSFLWATDSAQPGVTLVSTTDLAVGVSFSGLAVGQQAIITAHISVRDADGRVTTSNNRPVTIRRTS